MQLSNCRSGDKNSLNIKNLEFRIIGASGEKNCSELNLVKALIEKYILSPYITLLGSKTQNEVISEMDNAALARRSSSKRSWLYNFPSISWFLKLVRIVNNI